MMTTKIRPWDPAEHLDSDEMIAEYLTAALAEDDPRVFMAALADAARARGMSQIAKDAGLGRESLYKALAAEAHPRFETISKVLAALGLRLVAEPAGHETERTT